MKLDEYAVEVCGLKKSFKVYFDKGYTLKEKALSRRRNQYERHEVLNGISFRIKKGEAVGLIGQNGCGKSTTLKLLTRIMYPDSGSVTIRGRVSSLLELGAGFHPDMSGRENIYINASIFGLSRKEINGRIPDIIAFSELGEMIDHPVRTYSSGMYMRLAFSVAIHVDAQILLIDEILAVGDVNFQEKCVHKLMEIKKCGTTIVLVSHSTDQIERLCDRSIWIHQGFVKADGNAREVDQQYLKYMGALRESKTCGQASPSAAQSNACVQTGPNGQADENQPPVRRDYGPDVEFKERIAWTGDIRITCINSYDKNGNVRHVFETGEEITFRISYRVSRPVENSYFGLSIFRSDGLRCYGTNSKIDGLICARIDKDGVCSIVFPDMELLPGRYYVDVCVATREDFMLDYLDGVNAFEIYCTSGELGISRIPYQWDLSDV